MFDPHAAVARDVMHVGCTCIPADRTLRDAARTMSEEALGSLPICDADGGLIGIVTDRDLVVHGLAADLDPDTTKLEELASGRVVCAGPGTPAHVLLMLMEQHLIRRIPIVDDTRTVLGMVSHSDIALHLGRDEAGEVLEVLAASPPRQSMAY